MTTSAALIFLFFTSYSYTYVPLNYRSQSDSAEREIIGITQYINRAVDHYYSVFASTLQYTLSFTPNAIADALFECNLRSPTLSALDITGSGVTNRSCNHWLADYFGLPIDFNSTIRMAPSIANSIFDLFGYFGLNNVARGLYVTVHAPIVSTHWTLNYFEAINKFGREHYAPGYFNSTATGDNVGVYRTDLLNDFTDFIFHQRAPDLGDNVNFAPLQASCMIPKEYRCNKTKTSLSDIQATIGWNFLLDRWYHLGVGLRIGIPTGNMANNQYIFSPIVGNNKHWQAGAQLWGHYTFYVSENEEKQWMIYGLANITHLFNKQQCRVFDLLCKVNSRWMLAQKFTPNVTNVKAALLPDNITPSNLMTPSAQFANSFSPVANLTQRTIKSSYGVQCDAVLMLSYTHRHFNVDFGYNLWYRSKERITNINNEKTPLTTQLWALKGDSYVFGFTSDFNVSVPANIPIALSATQSKATIHSGTNNFVSDDLDQGGIDNIRPTRNPGIDNPLFAAATLSEDTTTVNDRTVPFMGEQTHTSLNPIFITEDQLDIRTSNTQGLSNKIFIYFNHIWADAPYNKPIPYLGSGLQLEWGSGQYAVSQWGIWLKGGYYFN